MATGAGSARPGGAEAGAVAADGGGVTAAPWAGSVDGEGVPTDGSPRTPALPGTAGLTIKERVIVLVRLVQRDPEPDRGPVPSHDLKELATVVLEQRPKGEPVGNTRRIGVGRRARRLVAIDLDRFPRNERLGSGAVLRARSSGHGDKNRTARGSTAN